MFISLLLSELLMLFKATIRILMDILKLIDITENENRNSELLHTISIKLFFVDGSKCTLHLCIIWWINYKYFELSCFFQKCVPLSESIYFRFSTNFFCSIICPLENNINFP